MRHFKNTLKLYWCITKCSEQPRQVSNALGLILCLLMMVSNCVIWDKYAQPHILTNSKATKLHFIDYTLKTEREKSSLPSAIIPIVYFRGIQLKFTEVQLVKMSSSEGPELYNVCVIFQYLEVAL